MRIKNFKNYIEILTTVNCAVIWTSAQPAILQMGSLN